MIVDHHGPGDLDLLERWRAGDPDAGQALFARHVRAVTRFFRSKIDRGIEDLVQDTFLACVEGRDRLRDGASFRAYLFATARHLLYARYRARGRQLDATATSVVDLGLSPSVAFARHERQRLLISALRSIPVDYQITLELTYWEGLRGHEVAVALGISANTVRSRLSRARRALRAAIERVEVDPGLRASTLADLDGWVRDVREAVDGGSAEAEAGP